MNLEGARQHQVVVDEYLSKELALYMIAGPYKNLSYPSSRSVGLELYQIDINKKAGD